MIVGMRGVYKVSLMAPLITSATDPPERAATFLRSCFIWVETVSFMVVFFIGSEGYGLVVAHVPAVHVVGDGAGDVTDFASH